jgi:hypothetical protein
MSESPWLIAALWIGLALLASLISIRTAISVALIELVVGAAVGIVVIRPEGTGGEAVHAADILVRDIRDGLDLLLKPSRLKATYRR